ncbi:MAG: prepilin-type N-terminal cleavage/methylation domain-containing protein [Candidatus Brocadiia bacterium]
MARRNENNRGRNAGFTLIETLIALTVAAVALVALLGLQVGNISLSDRSEQLCRATLLARAKLAEARADPDLRTGSEDGSEPQPGREAALYWRRTVRERTLSVGDAGQEVTVLEVTVEAGTDRSGHSGTTTLTTYVNPREAG